MKILGRGIIRIDAAGNGNGVARNAPSSTNIVRRTIWECLDTVGIKPESSPIADKGSRKTINQMIPPATQFIAETRMYLDRSSGGGVTASRTIQPFPAFKNVIISS